MKIRKTPLFYLVLLSCLLGVPGGIYGLTLTGGASLLGAVIFSFVFFAIVALVLEQLMVALLQPNIYGVLLIDLGFAIGVAAAISPFLG